MSEQKIITSISVITDSENSYDKIGIKCQYIDVPYLKTEIIPIELF
jgi:hypothetical protein